MTNKEITLCFAFNLLTLPEDPKGFEKYCGREETRRLEANKRAIGASQLRASVARLSPLQSPLFFAAWFSMLDAERRRAIARVCEWQKRNRVKSNEVKIAHQAKKKAKDAAFHIELNCRSRIHHALVRQRAKKPAKTLELLGVKSRQEFFERVMAKCPPEFTMENYGAVWELDHKRPCASFDLTDPEQVKQCFHYSNYQPLRVFDNRSKGAKWEPTNA